jgi:hypothetical protein
MRNAGKPLAIRRLSLLDAAHLEAHCSRLEPHNALDLFGIPHQHVAARRYVASIDFLRDIVLAGVEPEGNIRAMAQIRVDSGSRWGALLLAREREYVSAEYWNHIIYSAVDMARNNSVRWVSVESLGYDAETRDALEGLGFHLEADADGTIGELCLTRARKYA